MQLKDKVTIVTGASSGIGEATAILFAQEGAKVVVNYKTNEKNAKNIVSTIKKQGGQALAVGADVANPKEVGNLFKNTLDRFKKVDILLNNAGIASEPDFLKATFKDWQEIFNNDLLSTMLCSQYAAKIMLKAKSGKILNTCSIYGLDKAGREELMAYSAVKAAMINFTQTLAKLLAPNIKVNAIAPGYVKTPAWDGASKETINRYISRTYMKRWIAPEEIANAFLYLATAEAITGEVLVVDAGRTLIDY